MRAALAFVAVLAFSGSALASGPIGIGTPVEGAPPPVGGLEPGNKRAYWSRGEHRLFVSSLFDAGYLYLRPQIAIGYGKPHWRFAQLETSTGVSGGGANQYGGLRFALPFIEVRGGVRYQFPFSRTFIAEKDKYSRFDLEARDAPSARYSSFDSDLTATAPAYRGSIFAIVGANYVFGVTDGYDVYEEQLRVMVRSPWVYRARVGYAFRFGEQGAVRVGPVVETLYIPGRKATVIRGGIVATVVLTHNVEVLATFVPTIISPDQIGAAGGDFGQLGIRYRWASPAPPHTEEEERSP
jgi:hypothetical protein